jgi:hypothetical protein
MVLLLSSSSNNRGDANKPCARRGCVNKGVYSLEILHINKEGMFCLTCKKELEREGLVTMRKRHSEYTHESQDTNEVGMLSHLD